MTLISISLSLDRYTIQLLSMKGYKVHHTYAGYSSNSLDMYAPQTLMAIALNHRDSWPDGVLHKCTKESCAS